MYCLTHLFFICYNSVEDLVIYYTTSKQLIKNTRYFLSIKLLSFPLGKDAVFYGWGRKKSGQHAIALAKKYHASFVLLEDGFIRSVGLGVNGSPSFPLIEDSVGIYYDATAPSELESILNKYDFRSDIVLMETAA